MAPSPSSAVSLQQHATGDHNDHQQQRRPPLSTSPLRLESHWRVRAVRHPSLRLLACVAHTLATFFVCSSSPLNASLLTPAHVPVVTHWLAVTLARDAPFGRIAFHVALTVSLLLLLRLVVYRSLVQRAWNWHNELSTARRALSRLGQSGSHGAAPTTATSSLQAPHGNDSESEREDAATHTPSLGPIELHTHATASLDASQLTARIPIANADLQAQGSWTFVVGCYPLVWSIAVPLLERLTHGSAFFDAVLRTSHSSGSDAMVQLRAQSVLYQALMTLSVLKLLVTADQVLQDTHYSRAFFRNWAVRVRRVYVTYPLVRLLSCWLALVALVVVGVYLQGFARLQTAWLALNLSSANAAWTQPLFSNEAWTALLAAAVVALDVLWVVQDAGFPGFASPAGVRLFGLPVETLRVPFGLGCRRTIASAVSSKWLASFVVLGLLLPLESCHFVQLLTYAPASYGQYVDAASHRVRPLVALTSSRMGHSSSARMPADVTPTETLLLTQGAISRYFGWSAWERLPALGLVALALGFASWLSQHERVTVRYARRRISGSGHTAGGAAAGSVRLGHTSSSRTAERLPQSTQRTRATQQRLQQLYALRTRADAACLVLATLSVATVVAQLRSIWRSESRRETTSETSLRPLQAPGEAYGVLLVLLTVALVVQLVERYRIKMALLVLRNDLPGPTNSGGRLQLRMFPRELLGPFVLELLLCCACLPPFVHSRLTWHETRFVRSSASSASPLSPSCPSRLTLLTTSSSTGTGAGETTCGLDYAYPLEVVNLVVLVRLYWLVRWPRNRLVTTVGHVRHAGVSLDSLRWSFRVVFTLAPMQLLLALFASLWVATAAAVAILERPVPSLLESEEHALWLTIVTMSTVGYGDAYPLTALGRAVTFVGAVVGGAMLVSLLTSVFLETLTGSRAEHKVMGTIECTQWQQRMRHASAVLIASAWVWHCRRQQEQQRSPPSQSSSHSSAAEQRLFSAAYQLKRLRKQRPKATLDSLDALKVSAVAHWRTHALREWVAGVHAASQASLDALELELDALEQALVRVL